MKEITEELKQILRDLWTELHLYAPSVSEWDTLKARQFYKSWSRRIPSLESECNCRETWLHTVAYNPPIYENAKLFFEWSVGIHNDISRKLDKAELQLTEAYQLYWPDAPATP